jgi:hypothetical protein
MTSLHIQETIADERLPQMEELLDTSRMRENFTRGLGVRGIDCYIEECRIIRIKYRPARNCVVSYRLLLTMGNSGDRFEQVVSALGLGEGESREQFALAQSGLLVPTAIGVELFHLPELESVVWAFPNDRKLSGLPALANPELLKSRILPEVVKSSFGDEWVIVRLESDVIHYVAERACTVRVRLALKNTRTAETAERVIFGKTYCLDEGALAWQNSQCLWESDARKDGRLLIPQPLAYQPEIKTLWQAGLDGETMSECGALSPRFFELLDQAAMTVASLHRTLAPFAPTTTTGNIITKLRAAGDLLARVRPACRTTLHSLIDGLAAASAAIGERPTATLHGDLHLKNFFATKDRVALIDLDNICRGDPLQDVGSFVAAMHYRGLLEGRSFDEVERIAGQFIDAYRAEAGWEVSDVALNWHTAAAMIYERAYRCVTRLKAGRLAILDNLIEVARHISGKLPR